jgi:hypothetical protein
VLRTLLFLSLVGAAIYGFLVISGGNTNENQAIQTQNHPVGERLSSWGSYLAPSPSQNPQLATAQRPAQTPPQLNDDVSQNSERKSDTEYQLAASENQLAASENKTPAVGAKPQPVEASVFSPSIGSSTPTQVATESTEPQSAKPAPPKANKLHHQSAEPTGRGRLAVAKADHPFGNWALGR